MEALFLESKFQLVSKYSPQGDQPKAIETLVDGIRSGKKHQTLLGATGTGKTFTVSNVIEEINKPTLVLPIIKHLQDNFTVNLKSFFQIMLLNILLVITITSNQKPMFHRQIHLLKKMPVSMMKLINYVTRRHPHYLNVMMSLLLPVFLVFMV